MSAVNRRKSRQSSSKMAFCGMIVALAVALMLTGGMIPIATYCAPMFAGVLLIPILLEFGKKTAWTAYAAIALITLMLGIDKEAAFFFLFLGYYPILKWNIERLQSKPLRIALKLLIFSIAIVVMYAVLAFLLHMDAIVAEFSGMGVPLLLFFLLLLNACMLLYDRLLTPLSFLYVKKLRPKFKFLRQP